MYICGELIPMWFNFVKGLVISEDFPPFTSRETQQQYKILRAILMYLVKKRLARLAEIGHGVADLEDLPLNISRWTLQPHKVLHVINMNSCENVPRYVCRISRDER